MCEPVTIATLAISAASTVASAVGQQRAANAQARNIAEASYENDAALQLRQVQDAQASTTEMSQRSLEALRERGRLAAAFESGGRSASRATAVSGVAEGIDQATIAANAYMNQNQLQTQRRSNATSARHQQAAIRRPSLIGMGLQIAGDGLGAYAHYKATTPANKS